MLVNTGNITPDLTLATALTPAGTLLGLLVLLLAIDGLYHILTRHKKNQQIAHLKTLLDGDHGTNIKVPDTGINLTEYEVVQMELGILVHKNDKSKIKPALGRNVTVVHEDIVETYPAEGFVKIGGE